MDLSTFYVWHISKEGDIIPISDKAEGRQVDFYRKERGEDCCVQCAGPCFIVHEDVAATSCAPAMTPEEGETANICGHEKEIAEAENAAPGADSVLKSKKSAKKVWMDDIQMAGRAT